MGKRLIAFKIAVPIMTAIIVVAFAEIVASFFSSYWAPANPSRVFWVYDELLGWAHKPNQKGVLKHRDFNVSVSINSKGMRDDELPEAKIEGEKRILVLGDSFAWGHGVEKENIFCELIESKFDNTEFVNASVNGYGSDQEYLYLKYRGAVLQPDAVLLLFHPNDIRNNSRAKEYRHNKPKFIVKENKLVLTNYPVPKVTLFDKLDKFIYTKTFFLGRLRMLMLEGYRSFEKRKTNNNDSSQITNSAGFLVTKYILVAIKNWADENAVQFVIVSVPSSPEIVDFLKDASQSAGIPYLPLDDAFAGFSREQFAFKHDNHWNNFGNQIAADAISSFLLDLGILEN